GAVYILAHPNLKCPLHILNRSAESDRKTIRPWLHYLESLCLQPLDGLIKLSLRATEPLAELFRRNPLMEARRSGIVEFVDQPLQACFIIGLERDRHSEHFRRRKLAQIGFGRRQHRNGADLTFFELPHFGISALRLTRSFRLCDEALKDEHD